MVETQFIRPEACVTHSPACCSPADAHPLALLLPHSVEVFSLRDYLLGTKSSQRSYSLTLQLQVNAQVTCHRSCSEVGDLEIAEGLG